MIIYGKDDRKYEIQAEYYDDGDDHDQRILSICGVRAGGQKGFSGLDSAPVVPLYQVATERQPWHCSCALQFRHTAFRHTATPTANRHAGDQPIGSLPFIPRAQHTPPHKAI